MSIEPEILPQSQEPPNFGPVQAPTPIPVVQKKKFPVWMLAIVFLCVVALLVVLFQKNESPSQVVRVSVTPTPTTESVQTRPLSPIATTSAFIEFETKLDTVTRGIQNAPIDNQSLLPPSIDLPLGF